MEAKVGEGALGWGSHGTSRKPAPWGLPGTRGDSQGPPASLRVSAADREARPASPTLGRAPDPATSPQTEPPPIGHPLGALPPGSSPQGPPFLALPSCPGALPGWGRGGPVGLARRKQGRPRMQRGCRKRGGRGWLETGGLQEVGAHRLSSLVVGPAPGPGGLLRLSVMSALGECEVGTRVLLTTVSESLGSLVFENLQAERLWGTWICRTCHSGNLGQEGHLQNIPRAPAAPGPQHTPGRVLAGLARGWSHHVKAPSPQGGPAWSTEGHRGQHGEDPRKRSSDPSSDPHRAPDRPPLSASVPSGDRSRQPQDTARTPVSRQVA